MDRLEPPEGWRIWLADYDRGTWRGTLVHTAVPVAPTTADPADYSRQAQAQCQLHRLCG
jgi:hypothetical protein